MSNRRFSMALAIGVVCVQSTACGGKNLGTFKLVVEDDESKSEAKNQQGASANSVANADKSGDPSTTANEKKEEKQTVVTAVAPGSGTGHQVDPAKISEASSRQALNSCLKSWNGKAPFNDQSPYRLIMPGVMVFGIGTAVNDAQTTASPELVLIPAGVNVLGNASYRLLNPNAWYCLITTVNVLGSLSIEINSKAQLADSSVDIMVAGKQSANATGFVTVNVGGGIALKVVQ